MNIRTLARSFAAGEITPEMFGRIDLSTFQTGLATCRNFITLPHGPAMNRPGTKFVREVQDSGRRTRLIPFTYSTTQTMVLEFGHQYVRFHTDGATLMNGGVPYEVATQYDDDDIFDLHYVQSADVLTITHPGYPPRELRRLGVTNWTLTAVNFFPLGNPNYFPVLVVATPHDQLPARLPAPAFLDVDWVSFGSTDYSYSVTAVGDDDRSESLPITDATEFGAALTLDNPVNLKWGPVGGAVAYRVYRGGFLIAETTSTELDDTNIAASTVTPGGPSAVTDGTTTDYYAVTAVTTTGEESYPSTRSPGSSPGSFCTNDLTVLGTYNEISYDYVTQYTGGPTIARYNVYKQRNGLYGYIGTSPVGEAFRDDNIVPDLTRTPPEAADPFTGAGNYPAAVSYFEQRRLFGGTTNLPQNLWMTRTGTESNLSSSIPVRDDDAISFRIAAREANTIRHIVPLSDILLLTSSAEWRVTSVNSDAITPTSVSVKPQSFYGANNVQPVTTGTSMLYAQARGGHVREIVYQQGNNASGYLNTDMSLMSPHLFDNKTILDLAFARAPYPILWCVSSDGNLLGLTYVPEQKVAGWHRHDTDGAFESCCAVTEGDEDALYVVVRRTIGGQQKRYVERLRTRQFDALVNAYFVDCGLTYSGAPASTISGLSHLEGKTVSILGDGAVFPQQVVTGGAITLDESVSIAHIGLSITADMKTLPMSSEQIAAFAQGRPKNINKVFLRVYRSSGVFAGSGEDRLRQYKQRRAEVYGAPPDLIESDEIEIPLSPDWTHNGHVLVRQSDPLPLTVVSMTLEVVTGG